MRCGRWQSFGAGSPVCDHGRRHGCHGRHPPARQSHCALQHSGLSGRDNSQKRLNSGGLDRFAQASYARNNKQPCERISVMRVRRRRAPASAKKVRPAPGEEFVAPKQINGLGRRLSRFHGFSTDHGREIKSRSTSLLCTQEQTLRQGCGRCVKGHFRTKCTAAKIASFDHGGGGDQSVTGGDCI
jgi:hypothetical protein